MKIAMVQLQVKAGDVEDNRRRGIAMAEEAARKADVVVLPEIWTIGYALREVEKWAEDAAGPTIHSLENISRKYPKRTIVSGSLPFRHNAEITNGAVVIQSGQIVSAYQKIHLFTLFGEERFFAPGQNRCVFSLGDQKAGMGICYDLRFPELFRAMALSGAEIIFLPSEWPASRGAHWRILNQARAVENQIFMCAVNCVGEFKGGDFYGHSLLISPNGDILAEGGQAEDIIYGEVDFSQVAAVRKQISVWKDRRPEMYS